MSIRLFFEDLGVGDRWTSQGRTITETDVVNFAGLTGDYDPLHVDREYAAGTPFGKPIAHGLLGLSFVAGLGSHSPSVATVAFVSIQNWEFRRPAHIGDTVHVRSEILATRPNGRRCGGVTWKRELINSEGLVVQSGVFETLVSTKLAKPPQQKTNEAVINAPHVYHEQEIQR
jgi:acyl dehydratase